MLLGAAGGGEGSSNGKNRAAAMATIASSATAKSIKRTTGGGEVELLSRRRREGVDVDGDRKETEGARLKLVVEGRRDGDEMMLRQERKDDGIGDE